MKHLTLLAACMFTLTVALPAHAQIPRLISFQGILTDTGGQPVADGSHSVAFALYVNRTTTTPLWREMQSVEVTDGMFNVLLGSVTTLTLDFDIPYYLGIAVDGAPELQPRTRLAAAPYALRAVAADHANMADRAADADHADAASALAPNATGAVTSLNQLTGDIELTGAGGTAVTESDGTITITSSGGGGGIVSLQNTDGTITILNPTGPDATLGLVDGGVTGQKLADLAVTGAKLADDAVTGVKLADDAVTTAKIAPGAVTTSRISNAGASAGQVLSYDGSDVGWTTLSAGGVAGAGATGQIALWGDTKLLRGYSTFVYNGFRMGVGVSSPQAALHVDGHDGLLVTGGFMAGQMMNPGAGSRLHWYARVAAFRAGYAVGSEWDATNVGLYSAALGFATVASEECSFAFGRQTEASGEAATAFGSQTTASGARSTAFGMRTTADGPSATAMGYETTASGINAVAMGSSTTARGDYSMAAGHGSVAAGEISIAIGSQTSAGGYGAIALGNKTTASGMYSTAMGCFARTAGHGGAFVIGDNSTTSLLSSSADNEMTMRFAGGYRFYTSSNLSTGAFIAPGGSGWASPSDRNMKENITPVDGENLLASIRRLPVTEWNYISADPSVRYIGPMAQDFWQAFRLCGTDSLTINSVAIDGVNLAAIKALERRTRELRAAMERIADLEARIETLEQKTAATGSAAKNVSHMSELTARVQTLVTRITELEARLDEMQHRGAAVQASR